MTVKFKCSLCGEKIEAPPELFGASGDCPHCGGGIVVPPGESQLNQPSQRNISKEESQRSKQKTRRLLGWVIAGGAIVVAAFITLFFSAGYFTQKSVEERAKNFINESELGAKKMLKDRNEQLSVLGKALDSYEPVPNPIWMDEALPDPMLLISIGEFKESTFVAELPRKISFFIGHRNYNRTLNAFVENLDEMSKSKVSFDNKISKLRFEKSLGDDIPIFKIHPANASLKEIKSYVFFTHYPEKGREFRYRIEAFDRKFSPLAADEIRSTQQKIMRIEFRTDPVVLPDFSKVNRSGGIRQKKAEPKPLQLKELGPYFNVSYRDYYAAGVLRWINQHRKGDQIVTLDRIPGVAKSFSDVLAMEAQLQIVRGECKFANYDDPIESYPEFMQGQAVDKAAGFEPRKRVWSSIAGKPAVIRPK